MQRLLLLLLAGILAAQDVKQEDAIKKEVQIRKISQLEALFERQQKLSALIDLAKANIELYQRELAVVGTGQRDIFTDLCKGQGIEAPNINDLQKVCDVNLTNGTVTKKQTPPAR